MGTTGGPHGSVGGARAPHAMSAEYERCGYDITCGPYLLPPNITVPTVGLSSALALLFRAHA